MKDESILRAENIHMSFTDELTQKNLSVLRDIDLNIKPGEFFVILGPSGSGKSTLLRILAGLLKQTHGKITKSPATRESFIFQNFALFPWLTVSENISFGLHMEDMPKKDRDEKASVLAQTMGLSGFENVFPRELSGGMRQRVGIARALAQNPDLIFLDEPFSALDSFTAKKLRQELLSIWQEKKTTMIMVTHLIEEALFLADRIAIVSDRPATIKAIIENPLPRPRDIRSPEFFKLVDQIESEIG